jgi:hypothetical protein
MDLENQTETTIETSSNISQDDSSSNLPSKVDKKPVVKKIKVRKVAPVKEPHSHKSSPHKSNSHQPSSHKSSSHHENNMNELTIKIKPRRLIEAFVLILLLVGVFYLGRFTADPTSLTGLASFADDVVAGEEEVVKEVEDEVVVKEEVVASEPEPEVEAEPDSEPEAEAEVEVVAEGNDEEIVTTYDNVVMSIEGVKFDWKETWGKITYVDYVITNKESGTIVIDHFEMLVEGYEDFEKNVPVTSSIQEIKSMNKLEASVPIPNGFAYNEINAGELENVQVTMILYDDLGKQIGSSAIQADLSGTE